MLFCRIKITGIKKKKKSLKAQRVRGTAATGNLCQAGQLWVLYSHSKIWTLTNKRGADRLNPTHPSQLHPPVPKNYSAPHPGAESHRVGAYPNEPHRARQEASSPLLLVFGQTTGRTLGEAGWGCCPPSSPREHSPLPSRLWETFFLTLMILILQNSRGHNRGR